MTRFFERFSLLYTAKQAFFVPIQAIFRGIFSPDGGIFHGEQAGTDTGKQSAQKTGTDTGTRGNNRRIAGKADGDCLTGGNRQETGKGKQCKRKQGKGNITGYYVAFYV